MANRRSFSYDAALILKDAGLVAASAAAQVGGVDQILNVGNSVFQGHAIIDLTAIEIASNDEEYTVVIQGSSDSGFASDIQNLAEMTFGATEQRPGGAIDSLIGRYELPFVNLQNDVTYPYLRAYTKVAGTIATGINYSARVAKADDC